MDRNEKYCLKNARERYKFMSKSDFHTTTVLKLQVTVLVFSVLNASELIRGLTHARNLKKQCMYMENIILNTPLLIYFNFFPKVFSQNLSCQTRGAAYLRVRLIRRCLRY